MIKNIIFVTFVFGTCSQLYSMEVANQESPEQFTIQTDNHHLRFRRIDLHNLAEQDRQTLIEQFGDFDAATSTFGYLVAIPFKIIHCISPKTVLDIYTKANDSKFAKMPAEQKIMYHWFIENEQNNNEFVGKLSVSTYFDPRPTEYADRLMLEIGLLGSANYRNKKLATQLAMLAKQKLEQWPPFNDGIFCFSTRPDNIAIHKLAQKLGAKLILSHTREVDFEIFKLDEPRDLFIIPKEKK